MVKNVLLIVLTCSVFALFAEFFLKPGPPSPPMTPQQRAEIEELKMNCVFLSRTPMSAMTPKDLDDWDFCKKIHVPR
jgi:hypothetical protein